MVSCVKRPINVFNFRSNLDAQLGIVKLGLNLSGSRQNIDEPTTSVTGEGLMRYLTWFTRPTVPVRYSNGHYGFFGWKSQYFPIRIQKSD